MNILKKKMLFILIKKIRINNISDITIKAGLEVMVFNNKHWIAINDIPSQMFTEHDGDK